MKLWKQIALGLSEDIARLAGFRLFTKSDLRDRDRSMLHEAKVDLTDLADENAHLAQELSMVQASHAAMAADMVAANHVLDAGVAWLRAHDDVDQKGIVQARIDLALALRELRARKTLPAAGGVTPAAVTTSTPARVGKEAGASETETIKAIMADWEKDASAWVETAQDVKTLRRALQRVLHAVSAEMDRGYVLTSEPGAGPAWRARWNALRSECESALSQVDDPDLVEAARLAGVEEMPPTSRSAELVAGQGGGS